ncbi:MAG: carbohydrate-binding family 9-like protein [Mariniphaga sp.]
MISHRRIFLKNFLATTSGIFLCNQMSEANEPDSKQTSAENNQGPKSLVIKSIDFNGEINIDKAEKLLEENTEFQLIDTLNWSTFSYKPEVKFKMAYCNESIFLKFYVSEENILANVTKINGDVCTDSCVEFFISLGRDKTYYNFELNCVGVPHVEYGQKGKRIQMDPEIVKLIKVRSSLGTQPFAEKRGGHRWELMIVIPKACFCYDKDLSFKGLKANANFYKCGDKTSVPHYVTWSPVNTPGPDFHQPDFYGHLFFE